MHIFYLRNKGLQRYQTLGNVSTGPLPCEVLRPEDQMSDLHREHPAPQPVWCWH